MPPKFSRFHSKVLQFALENDTYQQKNLLRDHPLINILVPQTQDQQNIIHLASFNDNYDIIQIYFHYLEYQLSEKILLKSQIQDWLNSQNSEGFTSLHLASYRGNLKIIQILLKYGADYSILNTNGINFINKVRKVQGLSVFHVAAQGGSPLVLCYFQEKGFDIDMKDSKGFTPLHWAAYSGANYAVSFLLAYGAKLNFQDNDSGVTALHLATLQGNTKIVRKLLIKGIDRYLKDKSDKTALEVAQEGNDQALMDMLGDHIGVLELCNIKQRIRPIKKNEKPMIIFISLYLSCFLMTILFTFPYIQNLIWIYSFLFVSLATIVFFIISWAMDPGYVIKPQRNNLLQLLMNNEPDQICFECKLIRTKQSRHCDVCNLCVIGQDHHCPWINNCIGQRNHIVFYLYIVSLLTHILIQIILQSQHFNSTRVIRKTDFVPMDLYDLEVFKYFTFGYVISNCFFFIAPISILCYLQTCNLIQCQNQKQITIDQTEKELDVQNIKETTISQSLTIQSEKNESVVTADTVNLRKNNTKIVSKIYRILDLYCMKLNQEEESYEVYSKLGQSIQNQQ